MQDSPLAQTLRLIPGNRFKAFKRYVEGATTHPEFLSLCDYLSKSSPYFSDKRLDRDFVARALFQGNIRRLNSAASQLKKIADQFLVVSNIRLPKNNLAQAGQILLLESLALNPRLFKKCAKNILGQIGKKVVKTTRDYHDAYQCNNGIFLHHNTEKYQSIVPSLADANRNLDLFYLIAKLRLIVDIYHRSQIHPPEDYLVGEELILKLADHYREIPIVDLYLQLIPLLQKPEKGAFRRINRFCKDNIDRFESIDQQIGIAKLIHLGNYLYEKGDLSMEAELFQLYMFADEKDLMLHGGAISSITYINIVQMGFRLGEWVQTDDFIHRHFTHLLPGEKESMGALSNLYRLYYQKNYHKAWDHVMQMPSKQHFTNDLRWRTLTIQIFYELPGQEFNLGHRLRSLEKFVKYHNKWSENRKLIINAYLKFTRRLLKRRTEQELDGNLAITELLRTEILTAGRLLCRAWLLQKVNELLGVNPQEEPPVI